MSLGGAGSAVFGSKNVGTGKAVTVSGYTLSGADAGNYTLVQPTGLTANISAASLAITGLTANNNTPYTWFWLDLRGGPLVVEAPPNVLGLANDMWYRWVGDIGLVGPDAHRDMVIHARRAMQSGIGGKILNWN